MLPQSFIATREIIHEPIFRPDRFSHTDRAPAYADIDVERDKRDAIEQKAAKQAGEAKQRKMQRMKRDAEARTKD